MPVREYTDQQILDRVRECPSFRGFPSNFWLIGVRSDEDRFNSFDDKFYCFRGDKFVATWHCTTNAGTDMLNPSNPRGEAVLASGDIYYESHERRMHRGKVLAYCQRRPLPLYRDNDRDRHTEELGSARNEIVGINIHPASYQVGNPAERAAIQNWSEGCQVFAVRLDFDHFMSMTQGQAVLTYCLLPEWTPGEPVIIAQADSLTPAVASPFDSPAIVPPDPSSEIAAPTDDGAGQTTTPPNQQPPTTPPIQRADTIVNTGDVAPAPTNEQDVNQTAVVQTNVYQGVGFMGALKQDFAKVGGGNLGFQTLNEYATQASGWPPWVIGIISKLAIFAIVGGIAWFLFRITHYGIWKVGEWKRQRLQAEINTDTKKKNVEWS